LWRVRFNMPQKYKLESLPRPVNDAVVLKTLPPYRAVVIRFSGFTGDEAVAEEQQRLEAYINSNKLVTEGPAVYAYYDPPWTLPFFRRNEIAFKIKAP
jgi:hypothetical protein